MDMNMTIAEFILKSLRMPLKLLNSKQDSFMKSYYSLFIPPFITGSNY